MPAKREAKASADERALKQTKLDFGSSSRPKNLPQSAANPPAMDDHVSASQLEPSSKQGASSPECKEASEASVAASTDDTNHKTLKVIDKVGDIFDAPADAVIIHACNCVGNWGAGIAAAFKQRYPNAHKKHVVHCKGSTPTELIGTAQLIAPCEVQGKDGQEPPAHYVGCLFTSKRFGRNRDSPKDILAATGPAMDDLMKQVRDALGQDKKVSEIRTCQINSGLFAVQWERSREAIAAIPVHEDDSEQLTEVIAFSRE